MSTQKLPYDPKDKQSIIEYAQILVNSTLRNHISVETIQDIHKHKGSFGNVVEEYYFMYKPNSKSGPDFEKVGMELKTTPLKKDKKGNYSSKERLVITMINYMHIVSETFETSTFLYKASDILLISYLYDKDKNPLDYIIEVVAEWGLPKKDLPIFKQDWEIIVNKIRSGKAHEISSSDTMYLEACTKAANSSKRQKQPYSSNLAKPRAWALKSSYMTTVQNKLLGEMQSVKRNAGEENLPLIKLVQKRFEPYFGVTKEELAQQFNLVKDNTHTPKSQTALITHHILGVDENSKIEEFEKAGIEPKSIRIMKNGKPKEAMSFPKFDYYNLVNTEFEDSDFYGYLQKKYLFVIFREDEDGSYRLTDIAFWQMRDKDLEEARKCYEEMRHRTKEGKAEDSVKTFENRCCHVRPHARNAHDMLPAPPDGHLVVKKSFWLNRDYLQKEIESALQESKNRNKYKPSTS